MAPSVRPPAKAGNGEAPRSFATKKGIQAQFQRTIIYGPGGVGKSELCANMALVGIKPLFLDIGNGTGFLDVDRVEPSPATWDEMRQVLHDPLLWAGSGAVVLDDLTKAEELGLQWTLVNVPHEKGHFVTSIEGYGYGKGMTHLYETFLQLLGDLDAHIRAGRHVVCVAHDCTASVPNPGGEDWIRYEPRLQSPASGKASIRHRVKEWADHLLFVGFDTFVNTDGKGMGSGTRTIWPCELPTHLAKSRSLAEPIPYTRGSAELWQQLFKARA